MKGSKSTIDFTEGNIFKKIAFFALPIVGAELLQNLYNIVDAMVVGNFISGQALAAVSVCTAVSQLVIGFFNGMSVGASVLASRYFGAGNKERLSTALRTGFSFAVILGTILSVVGILLVPWVLGLIAVPQDVYADANAYLRIYLGGVLFTVIYNVAAGLLRAIGDSRGPLLTLIVVCVLNIGLDLFFVIVMKWGVAGASFATVISQFVSVVVAYILLKRHDGTFHLALHEPFRERKMIATIAGIGLPAGVQVSLISFSNLFVWRYVSGFNAAAMAGMGVAQKVDKFVSMPCKGVSLALTTFVSQNIGARKQERISRGIRVCIVMSLTYCVCAGTVVYTIADWIVRFFGDSPDVVAAAVQMMHTMLPFYFLIALRDIWVGVMRAWGDTKFPMVLMVFGMVVVRQIYLAVSLAYDHRLLHIFIGYPLAWGAAALLIGCYYAYKRRHYSVDDIVL